MTILYSKYKDADPQQTVKTIKEHYASLQLNMEYSIEKHIDGVYSAYLYDVGGRWNTAGKGTTEAFCLASAYGESMEHLCNHFAFDISKTSERAKAYGGFCRYYDEIQLPIEAIEKVSPIVFRDMRSCCGTSNINNTEIIEIWKKVLQCNQTPFIPYFNISSRKTELLPDAVLSKLCGSNGGGSGNTPEEAIGHALDEAIERYVKYKIVFNNLTPPTIPREYIREQCPELHETIKQIEAQGRFNIIVKDASLGKGFSVVCILVIDNQTQRYLTNFGAHPRFEIALERCLTELFQDHECVDYLIDRADMTDWNTYESENSTNLSNWVSLLRDDIGSVPNSVFFRDASWEFAPWKIFDVYNNKIGVIHQLQILKENGFDVFIRDNSILDFPVYKVYIPFLSLSHIIFDNRLADEAIIVNHFFEYLSNDFPVDKKQTACDCAFSEDAFLLRMLLHNWNQELFDFLYATLLFDIHKPEKAVYLLKQTSFACATFLKRYIEMTLSGMDSKKKEALLYVFYGEKSITWLKHLEAGNAFALLQEYCQHSGLLKKNDTDANKAEWFKDELYQKIKSASQRTQIDQNRISSLLESFDCT